MTLVVGGVGQGKLDYVLAHTGLTPDRVFTHPAQAGDRPIFDHVETWVRSALDTGQDPLESIQGLLRVQPQLVLICDEVGCGVVPMDPGERRWREAVGRLCCALAQRADTVVRVFCGIPVFLKGSSQWS